MLKLLVVGLFGITATVGGLWLNQYLELRSNHENADTTLAAKPLQVKTEMTGIPVVLDGVVTGYLVFQISSTIDQAKLPSSEFDVAPYILDASIRASYQSTETGLEKFNAAYFEKLAENIREKTNQKLNVEIVSAVNVEQFNFVPKEDIRGKVNPGGHQ